MTKFWRLFTSDYLQEFIDSVSIPTGDELTDMFLGTDFDNVLKNYKEEVLSMLEQIPSFKQLFELVKESTFDQLEKNK